MEISEEKLVELLAKAVRQGASGLGKPRPQGLGCGDGNGASVDSEVSSRLALGSPRLALAAALGVRLMPYDINIRATFDNVDTTDIPRVGSEVKIVQDTIVDAIVLRIINKSNTANDTTFAAQRDYFFNFQSGIEATLDIAGTPRPSLVPNFTPLASIAERFPCPFVLTYQQQLMMAFHASITLPYAPIEVVFTFQCRTSDNEMFSGMTNKEAFDMLAQCGYCVDDAYCGRVCAICR